MNRAYATGVLQVAIAAASWGTWSLFLRPSGMPAALCSPLMLAVMSIVALAGVPRDPVVPRWDARTRWLVLAHGACDALNVVTFFGAMEKTSLALSVLSHYLAPLLVAVASPWVGESRIARAPACAAAGLAGLALVLEPWRASDWSESTLLGVGLGATSACAYAANVILSSKISARIGITRMQGYHCALAALFLLPLALQADASTLTVRGVSLVLVGSIFVGALSGLLFVRGLRIVGTTTASMLTFLEPIVAVAIGVFVWGERLSPIAGLGVVLVIAAGAAVVYAQKPTSSETVPGSVV